MTSSTQPIAGPKMPPLASAAAPISHRLPRFALRLLEWGIPAALVVALAIGFARYRAAHPNALVHYETGVVDRGALAAKVTATGALSALVTVQVGSQVSGRIGSLSVDFESVVKQGQTIATIEPSLFKAQVAQARASFLSANAALAKANADRALAERQFERAKALLAEGLMSKSDYDTAEATVDVTEAARGAATADVGQARASLDQALLNLHYTMIVSPIDGVVISRNVDVGQTVAAALQAPTLFTIAQDLTHMQVDTNVAEADVGKIRPALAVTFTVDAYPQREFKGVVRQVRDNAQTLQNVVTYDAVIDVDNSERLLKPGMTASVVFTYATRESVLRIPNAALRFKPDAATLAAMDARHAVPPNSNPLKVDERVVWVLHENEAAARTIRTGITDGSSTEALAGDLRDGDRVVVEANSATPTKP